MSNPKVLLVEDDMELSDILKDQLELLGCDVITANNGLEAIEVLKDHKFTCLISDIRMPKMDGMQMLTSIREKGIDVPVVFMTGFSTYTEKEVAQKGGAVLLEKPFNSKQLKELVQSYIELLPHSA